MKTSKFFSKSEVTESMRNLFDGSQMFLLDSDVVIRHKDEIYAMVEGIEVAGEDVYVLMSGNNEMSWEEDFSVAEMEKIYDAVKYEKTVRENGDCRTALGEFKAMLRNGIYSVAKGVKKFRFSETEAPRMYIDGGWRELISLEMPEDSRHDMIVGWHDERCSNKGVNARMTFGRIPAELMVEFYELVCRKSCNK